MLTRAYALEINENMGFCYAYALLTRAYALEINEIDLSTNENPLSLNPQH